MPPCIEARSLSFRHGLGPCVFEGLSFFVKTGEFVCLLGRSGRGKTTLLRLVAGLERPVSGELLVNGCPVEGPGIDRGMVFQEHSLFPWLTALDNVAFGVRRAFRGLSRKEARAKARQYLERVGLVDSLDKYPFQMSGGMQQRASVARMLAMNARIWLFDEPFSAVDPLKRHSLQRFVERLWASYEPRKTVLFVTHNVDEAILLADRILFLGKNGLTDDLRVTTPRPREAAGEEERFALKNRLARLFTDDREAGI